MKNSGLAIPWTHRDSRPRSQAELDAEESFDAHRRLKIPRAHSSDLHQRLEHYQAMISKLLADQDFRVEIDIATETTVDRKERKESDRSRENVKKKGLYSSTPAERSAKRRKKEATQANFFTHLDEVFSNPAPIRLPDRSNAPLESLYEEYHLYTPELREAWKPSLLRLIAVSQQTDNL